MQSALAVHELMQEITESRHPPSVRRQPQPAIELPTYDEDRVLCPFQRRAER